MFDISFIGFVTQLLNGLVLGLTFALLAIGLSIIFGMLVVVNFAHGAFYMLGAYFAVYAIGFFGNFWLALIVSAIAMGLLGIVTEYITFRPLYGKDPILPLLLTFGLSMIFVAMALLICGPLGKSIRAPAFVSGPIDLGFITYSKYSLFVIVFSSLLASASNIICSRISSISPSTSSTPCSAR